MNLIESVDLQRAIRGTAYKKAAQLYGEKNRARGWEPKPTVNQIRGVFRIGYNQLYKRHPRTTWLNFEDKPFWISKLDYVAARGGKPLLEELLDIISKIGGQFAMVNPTKLIRYPGVQAPEPPLGLNEAFDKAIEFMDGNDEH
jgi:hypothetical protein